jgi:hypothetical protein
VILIMLYDERQHGGIQDSLTQRSCLTALKEYPVPSF